MRIKRYIFFLFDVLKSNLGVLNKPFKLNFVITKSCNSKCLNCNIWQVKPENELSLEEIQNIANHTGYLKWIDFTGGEPTNRKDFFDIVKAFYDKNPNLLYVHFPTNAILTDKIVDITKKIDSIGSFKTVVTVSIDGPSEVNDKLRGVPNDFRHAVNTFKKLKKIKGVDVYIGCTLFKSNYKYIDQLYKELKENISNFKFSDLHFNLGHVSEHYYENNISNDISPSIKIIEELEKFEKKYKEFNLNLFSIIEYFFRKKLKKYLNNNKTPMSCLSGKNSIYLSEHGVIYPCSMWDNATGQLRKQSYNIENILKGEDHLNALKQITNGKCAHCWTPCEAYQTMIGNVKDLL